jgi:hypothetical protein
MHKKWHAIQKMATAIFTQCTTTSRDKTGIVVESLPAKSSVSVSIDANEAGENLPARLRACV